MRRGDEKRRREDEETWPYHLLLEPQREVGGVSDHPQQVGRVDLLVLFGPDAADQF